MSHHLELTRTLSISPQECFKLWQDPKLMADWWGPYDDDGKPFTSKIDQWEPEVGKEWEITMTAPSGKIYRQTGSFLDIDPPNKLHFTFRWTVDGETGPTTEIEVKFNASGTGTELVFTHKGFADVQNRDSHIHGWNLCLDRFEKYIA